MTDSHFHMMHIKKKELDNRELLTGAFSRGLVGAIDIGIEPETWNERNNMAKEYPGLYLAGGLYPSHCEKSTWETDLKLLEEHLTTTPKIAALGEIGLDYYHNYGTKDDQKELFQRQLELANSLDLPVIIHCRDSEEDTLECLKEHPPSKGGIMHCFSLGPEWTDPFLDMGFYISFAGNLTYKKNEFIREAAARVPDDRILMETDAPYLSPIPVRGRPNHPGYIGHTYRAAAEIRKKGLSDFVAEVKVNFENFIGKTLNQF